MESEVGPNPCAWAEGHGIEQWSKSREIVASVLEHRRTVVRACHSSSKTHTFAWLMLWWALRYRDDDGRVVVLGPGARGLTDGVWATATELHARLGLDGRMVQGAYWLPYTTASGASSERKAATAFSVGEDAQRGRARTTGYHARHLLAIYDEASGILPQPWMAGDSWGAERYLCGGNPEGVLTPYHRACEPDSTWNLITIGHKDCPAFTGEKAPIDSSLLSREMVDDWRIEYGEESDFWQVAVLGEFPAQSSINYYPLVWVKAAHEAEIEPEGDVILGCDIGGGGDPTEVYARRGPHVRRVTPQGIRMSPDGGLVGEGIAQLAREQGARTVVIDSLGESGADALAACVSSLRDEPIRVRGVNTGRPAKNDHRYVNLKAEIHEFCRQSLRTGALDLDEADQKLTQELMSARSAPPVGGREQIEAKVEEKRRLGRSPDRRDALLLTWAGPTVPQVLTG